ncbi:hypothetical protein C1645_367171 [Glomus cerebriforme]|uniref:Uncharacterized protein n=1 Tax=Glomus cerebriforme TaxID=658196 RepID=A0A397TNK4_9GLOM|nr:hypothetical protein C1645_367171 [Glomus cerebriforme]
MTFDKFSCYSLLLYDLISDIYWIHFFFHFLSSDVNFSPFLFCFYFIPFYLFFFCSYILLAFFNCNYS